MKSIINTRNLWWLLLSLGTTVHSQTIALKSDLLSSALTSPNIAVEVKLSERFTLETSLHYNPISLSDTKRWKHWFIQPELRYWMCQPFGGDFLGVNFAYGWYNVGAVKLPLGLFKGVRDQRYQGNVISMGLSYGYNFILSPRWSIETTLGVGYVHSRYKSYRCLHCGEQTGGGTKNFLAPTRTAISLIYLIK